jgi:hypothetical protein
MPRIDVAHNHSMNRVLSWIGLTEVYTDDSQLNSIGIDDDDSYISTCIQTEFAQSLERLSIQNLTWTYGNILIGPAIATGHAIKKVRHHPSLRWLMSNHSEENITIPRCERREITIVCDELCWKRTPEITFVSDKLCWEHTFQVGYLCIF